MNLREVLKEDEHSHAHRHLTTRQRAILAIAGIIMLAGLLLSIWIGLARTNEIQDNVGLLAEANNAILRELKDCNTEGGECFQQEQDRQSGYLRAINDAVVYAAWCAEQLGQDSEPGEVKLCVERLVDVEAGRGDE